MHRINGYTKIGSFCFYIGWLSIVVTAIIKLGWDDTHADFTYLIAFSGFFFFFGWLLNFLRKQGKYTMYKAALGLFGTIVFSFFLAEFLVFQGMQTRLPEQCKYVIVLGAGLLGDEPSLTLKNRLDAAIVVLNKYPEAKVIASGGVGKESIYSEAEVMRWYFIKHGIDESRILKEEQATRTDENLLFAKHLVTALDGNDCDQILVSTSDYHMFRSGILAQRYFSEVYTISASSPIVVKLNYAVREYLALIKMAVWK